MAIASAALLGFRFPINFAWPFFAPNVALHWNRWHISLSGWFRDYVYSTLIGLKRNQLVVSLSLLITFFLSGLWHGAGWKFIVFGVMHGVAILLFRLFKTFKKRVGIARKTSHPVTFVVSIAVTYLWFCSTALFFRAEELGIAWDMMGMMFRADSNTSHSIPSFIPIVWCILVVMHWIAWRFDLIKIANNLKPPVYGIVLGVCIAIIITGTPSNQTPFLYFQF